LTAAIWCVGAGMAEPRQPPRLIFAERLGRLFIALGPINNRMHNRADVASGEVGGNGPNFSARFHIPYELIYLITFLNSDLAYSKTGQISRDARFGVFQLS